MTYTVTAEELRQFVDREEQAVMEMYLAALGMA